MRSWDDATAEPILIAGRIGRPLTVVECMADSPLTEPLLRELERLDGDVELVGARPSPSPATVEALAQASLERSMARRRRRRPWVDLAWAAVGGLVIGGAFVVGFLL